MLANPLAAVRDLLKEERASRPFFVAHAQSSLGTGAAAVALLVLAYERFRSPWAVALTLIADLAPAMLLGPVFGAVADRFSRKGCMVAADGVRAIAFLGVAAFADFGAMLGFALLAGVGTALFRPAVMAALPGMVEDKHRSAATSIYGTFEEMGYTVGPAIAAGILVLATAETVMLVNSVTFAISGLVLVRVSLRAAEQDRTTSPEYSTSLIAATREGIRTAVRIPGVPTLIIASTGIILFAGLFNVGELLLARAALGAGPSGYAVLVAIYGLGVAGGSLCGAGGGSNLELKHRYLAGLLMTACGFLGSGLAPDYAVALSTFALGGIGNGLIIVHERLLFQALVPDASMGRVYSVKDALQSWAFLPGLLCGGALISAAGPRTIFVFAGLGAILTWWAAGRALGRSAKTAPQAATASILLSTPRS